MAKRKSTRPAAEAKAVTKAATKDVVYQLKITLMDVDRPVWRRFVVKDVRLDELHAVIQVVMGWENGHLHMFDFGDRQYSSPHPGSDFEDDEKVTLGTALGRRKVFGYEYDFGDSWAHRVEVEKKTTAAAGEAYPRCLAGERACPPEDCGGAWGYEHFKKVMANPKHKEHADLTEWYGGPFDPEAFDLAAVNKELAKLKGSRGRGRGGWGWFPA